MVIATWSTSRRRHCSGLSTPSRPIRSGTPMRSGTRPPMTRRWSAQAPPNRPSAPGVADLVDGRAGGGRIVAAQQTATDVGAFVGPVAAGLVADRTGLGPALAVSGLLLLAPVAAWLLVPRRPAAA